MNSSHLHSKRFCLTLLLLTVVHTQLFAQVGLLDDGIRLARYGSKAAQIRRVEQIMALLARNQRFKNARFVTLIDDEMSFVHAGSAKAIDNLPEFIRTSSDDIVFDVDAFTDDALNLGKAIYVAGYKEPYLVTRIDGTAYLIDGPIRYRITEQSRPVNYVNKKTWQYRTPDGEEDELAGDIMDVADQLSNLLDLDEDTVSTENVESMPVAISPLLATANFDLRLLFEASSENILIIPGIYDGEFSVMNEHTGVTRYEQLEEMGKTNDVYCIYIGFPPGTSIDYATLQATLEHTMMTDSARSLMNLYNNFALLSTKFPVLGHSADDDRLKTTLLNAGTKGINFLQLSSRHLFPGEDRDRAEDWWEDHFVILWAVIAVLMTIYFFRAEKKQGKPVGGPELFGFAIGAAIAALIVWALLWLVAAYVVSGLFGY